jgi:hypothetical protein
MSASLPHELCSSSDRVVTERQLVNIFRPVQAAEVFDLSRGVRGEYCKLPFEPLHFLFCRGIPDGIREEIPLAAVNGGRLGSSITE